MNADAPQYDVLVVGGGMVGSLFAAALAGTALRIAVLEPVLPDPFEPGSEPPYDLRVSAINAASERFFRAVGAWQGVIRRRAAPFRSMLVWDDESIGRTEFNAGELKQQLLGHIVENRVLQLALLEQLRRADNITVLCPMRFASAEYTADRVVVHTEAGDRLTARLLVAADGARSAVREQAGIAVSHSAYPQHALVATVATALPQQAITWQRFVPSGPQAFLPLVGERASIVWYHSPERIAALRELDDSAFIAALQAAFPPRLGGITGLCERGSFPLGRAHAARYVDHRLALIGDAAHTVHPLAGQGVNLGMLDAAALSEVVLDAARRQHDIGLRRHLRPYERWRRPPNTVMIEMLDGFYRAFREHHAAVRHARGAALLIADTVAPLKRLLMREALGIGPDLPALGRMALAEPAGLERDPAV